MTYLAAAVSGLLVAALSLGLLSVLPTGFASAGCGRRLTSACLLAAADTAAAVLCARAWGISAYGFLTTAACACAACIAVEDALTGSFPNLLIWMLLAVSAPAALCIPDVPFADPLITGGVIGLAMLIARRVRPESIGGGDAMVLPILGLLLGYYRAGSVLLAALLTALLFGLGKMIIRRTSVREQVRFMPFLALGLLLALAAV